MKKKNDRSPRPRQRLLKIYRRLEKAYGPQGWWPAKGDFEMIVGAILTQNTSWANVTRALDNLQRAGLLTPKKMAGLAAVELGGHIRPAGYFRQKSRTLKEFLRFLREGYRGNLEDMLASGQEKLRAGLLGVRGIGPETADSIVLYAGHYPVFVVDAYTGRIFRCQGLIAEGAKYAEIQGMVMAGLEPDERLFNEFHALLVHLGKTHCRKNPRCEGCPLIRDRVSSIS
ncbi:MAG: endonuclease III domain-containing protein [bacterium]|nr:endonuclease III domain-containing protein [bacterium]